MVEDGSENGTNYEMHLKSTSGEISVYIIQPELAESYDNNCMKLRLQPEPKKVIIKEEKVEEKVEEKKEEIKQKKRVGRYLNLNRYFSTILFFIFITQVKLLSL